MNGLAVVTVGSFAAEQNFMTCGMVGSLERNIQLLFVCPRYQLRLTDIRPAQSTGQGRSGG